MVPVHRSLCQGSLLCRWLPCKPQEACSRTPQTRSPLPSPTHCPPASSAIPTISAWHGGALTLTLVIRRWPSPSLPTCVQFNTKISAWHGGALTSTLAVKLLPAPTCSLSTFGDAPMISTSQACCAIDNSNVNCAFCCPHVASLRLVIDQCLVPCMAALLLTLADCKPASWSPLPGCSQLQTVHVNLVAAEAATASGLDTANHRCRPGSTAVENSSLTQLTDNAHLTAIQTSSIPAGFTDQEAALVTLFWHQAVGAGEICNVGGVAWSISCMASHPGTDSGSACCCSSICSIPME